MRITGPLRALAALSAALLSITVHAQTNYPIKITSPSNGTTFLIGSTYTITWSAPTLNTSLASPPFSLNIFGKDSNSWVNLVVISRNVWPADNSTTTDEFIDGSGSLEWTVPFNQLAADDSKYFVSIYSGGLAVGKSDIFKIVDDPAILTNGPTETTKTPYATSTPVGNTDTVEPEKQGTPIRTVVGGAVGGAIGGAILIGLVLLGSRRGWFGGRHRPEKDGWGKAKKTTWGRE